MILYIQNFGFYDSHEKSKFKRASHHIKKGGNVIIKSWPPIHFLLIDLMKCIRDKWVDVFCTPPPSNSSLWTNIWKKCLWFGIVAYICNCTILLLHKTCATLVSSDSCTCSSHEIKDSANYLVIKRGFYLVGRWRCRHIE